MIVVAMGGKAGVVQDLMRAMNRLKAKTVTMTDMGPVVAVAAVRSVDVVVVVQ